MVPVDLPANCDMLYTDLWQTVISIGLVMNL